MRSGWLSPLTSATASAVVVPGCVPKARVSVTGASAVGGLLMARVNWPVRETPGIEMATLPLSWPARPPTFAPAPAGSPRRKKPVPWVTVTYGVVPSPKVAVRLRAPMRVTRNDVSATAACSKGKTPASRCPSLVWTAAEASDEDLRGGDSRLLEGEVAGQPLPEHGQDDAGSLHPRVRPGRQIERHRARALAERLVHGCRRGVRRDAEAAGEGDAGDA